MSTKPVYTTHSTFSQSCAHNTSDLVERKQIALDVEKEECLAQLKRERLAATAKRFPNLFKQFSPKP